MNDNTSPRLPEQASVHRATVTRYSQGELEAGKRTRRSYGRRPNADTWGVKAHQLVQEAALAAAGGDARRLETHRDGSITVHNDPAWRKG